MTIKKTIAIASAKGGVGKSTVCSFLATVLSKDSKVGILDADIYGPNQDILFDINDKNIEVDKKNTDRPYIPKKVDNISLNSLGFLLDKNAAIWRGPMLSSAINQIYEKTNWDELDFLLIDMPPGTGDAYLTVCQKIVPDFVILVSTISKLSIADLRRSEHVFASLNTKVLGIILNNIHQSDDFQSFNLETENTVLDRLEYDKKFIDSTYPFDDLKLDPLFLNTIRKSKSMNRFLLILLLSFPIFGEEINDPFEDLNRDIFIFNEKLDEKLLKPAALTYRKVTPQFARTGVTNFFNNLEEIDTTINQVLQGEIKYAFNDAGRFVINSTIGLFGLIDVASKMGLEKHEEDFGQTLGVWGFDSGPYIMIPFLGPSNPRDLLSRPISSFLSGTFAMEDNDVKITLVGIDALETRERLLDAETLIIGDKYIFVKDAYIQSREYEINNGSTEDDEFLDDMEDIFGDD